MIHWLHSLLTHYGYWVVFGVVFLNNLCFPVPGDTVLVGAGFLAQKGTLALWAVVAVGAGASFLGSTGGYWLGLGYGRRLLKKIRWLQVKPERVERGERFFEKYGPKVVFFARFIAVLHPVIGLLAGMWKTPWRPFLFYNLAGALCYVLIYTLVGYFFGQNWEAFKSWLGPVALYVILIAAALLALGLFLRHSIHAFIAGFSPKKKNRRGK